MSRTNSPKACVLRSAASPALADIFAQFREYLEKNVTLTAERSAGDNKEHSTMLKQMAKALGLNIDDSAKDEEVQAAITKAFADRDREIALLKADMTANERKYHDGLPADKQEAFRKADHAARTAEMTKHAELPEYVRKALAEADDVKKRLAALEEKNEIEAVRKRVSEAGLPETEVENVRKLFKADKAATEAVLKQAAAGWAAAKAAGAFREVGVTGGNASPKAYDEFAAKAEELRKKEPGLSFAQAFAKAVDPANTEIAKRERAAAAKT